MYYIIPMKEFQLERFEIISPTIEDMIDGSLPCWARIPTDPDCEDEFKLPIISDNENTK